MIPPFPPEPLFLFLLTPSLMDPHSAIHQGQVYSILVHVSFLLLPIPYRCLLPTPLVLYLFLLPPPPTLPCPSLLASVPARLARTSSFFLLFFLFLSFLLLFTLLLQLRSHISHDGSSGAQPHPPPHVSAAQKQIKNTYCTQGRQIFVFSVKTCLLSSLLMLFLLWIAPNGLCLTPFSFSVSLLRFFHFL